MSARRNVRKLAFAPNTLRPATSLPASAADLEIICLPVTDETLCSLIREADVAFYLTETGSPDHPAFLGLREALTSLVGANARTPHRDSRRDQPDLTAEIAVRRRMVSLQMGLEVLAGLATARFGEFSRRALVVYGARQAAFPVSLTLPACLLHPPIQGKIH